jgi:predicted RNase H-like HicB family nuclease
MFDDDDVHRAVLTAVFLDEDDGGVTGFIEEFWGVTVRAKNLIQARKQLKEAAQTFIDDNREDILRRMDCDGQVTREKMLLEI